jgi:hypothetical protein
MRVKWTLDKPWQKFWPWTPADTKDLGDELLEGRDQAEVWTSLDQRNPTLGALEEYQLFAGQREVMWGELPLTGVTVVPELISVPERGTEFRLVEQNSVPKPRMVGPLIRADWEMPTSMPDQMHSKLNSWEEFSMSKSHRLSSVGSHRKRMEER